ncbi:MAG: type II toxin-antitoxin system RelE/ParE family toxin [Clostridiales bacterium]|nr:type II toxin-antitoxin system RelE/ParE family toxin [Clostridiales bacterium]
MELDVVAQNDRLNIVEYLYACNASDTFRRLDAEFKKTFELLAAQPESGTPVKFTRYKHYRFVIVKPYYVFYVYKNGAVYIKRIIHTARNYKKLLAPDGNL